MFFLILSIFKCITSSATAAQMCSTTISFLQLSQFPPSAVCVCGCVCMRVIMCMCRSLRIGIMFFAMENKS